MGIQPKVFSPKPGVYVVGLEEAVNRLSRRVEVDRVLVARKLVSEARMVRQELIQYVMALTGIRKRQAQRRIRFKRGKSRTHIYSAITVLPDSAVVHKGRLVPIKERKERVKGKGATKVVGGKRKRRSRRAGITVAGEHYPRGFIWGGKGEKRRLYERIGKGGGFNKSTVKAINVDPVARNITILFKRHGRRWVARVNRRVLRYAISLRSRHSARPDKRVTSARGMFPRTRATRSMDIR